MSAINSETFRAGTFDFYIGPDEIQFSLYKNLVSRYSEPLGRMMANGMKESREGKAFLKGVDPDTFCRFAEFIHSGNYSAAAPVEVPLTPEDDDILPKDPVSPPIEPELKSEPDAEPSAYEEQPVEDVPETEEEWRFSPATSKKKAKTKTRKGTIWDLWSSPSPPSPFPVDSAPGLNQSPTMSYARTFACHVSVYHFAEFYLVLGLEELARQKLSEALNIFQCFPERTGDICHVVRLVYNHEDGNTHPSPLHNIVSNYATNNFKVLTESRHFNELLAEGGLFPPDVCRRVARCLD
ncbi:hypothetical protein DBV05_g10167 [Lasiodiplodia theobromae]|uniref:BTB domain-containing protein n=1 Tax=Lasiodiplodia theobromae TaxID=45133 RepID=A0A5N5D0R3_9PEZI|nr:hypothetical protein DBV05_g10167 [Lasiodiplodia theobromae]